MHVRNIKKSPSRLLGYQDVLGRVNTIRKFDKNLEPAFRYNVVDSAKFVAKQPKQELKNYCVFVGIVLKLHTEQNGQITDLTKAKVYDLVNLMPISEFVKTGAEGVLLGDFRKLEKTAFNSNKLHMKYPFLKLQGYKTFAFNIFRVQTSTVKTCKSKEFHLVPLYLSASWKESDSYQIDFLLDNGCLWQKKERSNSDLSLGIVKTKSYHLLCIINLPKLLGSFTSLHNGLKQKSEHQLCCRACLKSIKSRSDYLVHIKSCDIFGRNKTIVLKRPKNTVIHMPFKKCKFTHKKFRNTLKFDLRNSFHTIAPCLLGTLDFESRSQKVSPDLQEKPPNAVEQQHVLAVSMTFGSPYTSIEIPSSLSEVHTDFLDEEKENPKAFFMRLLLKIREKFYGLKHFLKLHIKGDRVPRLKELSLGDQLRYFTTTSCQLCGRTFGRYYGKRNGRKLLKKAIHHLHFVKSANLASVVCCTGVYLFF